ncbi:hypothetical protein GCM10008936_17470 [Alkalibacterium indicireducens]|uniref:Uncharacterized protein n=1 Tax=Alkalibacterium indicireducens TaxID=398758 RepID=A0ABP3KZM5_9LACT
MFKLSPSCNKNIIIFCCKRFDELLIRLKNKNINKFNFIFTEHLRAEFYYIIYNKS